MGKVVFMACGMGMISFLPEKMRMRHGLVLLVACSLFLLGCAATEAPGQAAPQDGMQNESAAGQSHEAESSPGNGSAGEIPAAIEVAAPETKTYSADFSGLVAMGIPLECDVEYTYSGKAVDARMLISADSEIRVESPEGMQQCAETITVIRGTRQYVGCEGKMIIPSCDWFKSGYDPGRPGKAASFDFSQVPASSISCRDWEYDASAFSTGGTICELG
jgi:hypothetical protein